MRTLSASPTLLFIAAMIVGCSSAPFDGENVGWHTSRIINGAVDTTHQAVVAILSQNGTNATECSGTIFLVNGSTGYALTAAHCCNDPQYPPQVIVQGNDYNIQSD